MSTFNHIASIIVYSISDLLKLIQFQSLYIVYAAGLTLETPYKLLQVFQTCREIPLFQKTSWTDCSKGTQSILLMRKSQTVHAIHPMRFTIYISWTYTPPYQIQRRRYLHLHLETLCGDHDSEAKDKDTSTLTETKINLIYSVNRLEIVSVTVGRRTQMPTEGAMCIKYLTKCIYSFWNFNKNVTCRNLPLKKCDIYILYICL